MSAILEGMQVCELNVVTHEQAHRGILFSTPLPKISIHLFLFSFLHDILILVIIVE